MTGFKTAAWIASAALLASAPAHAVITTFATFSALTTDNFYFKNALSNNKSSSASLYSIATPTSTVPGSVLVKFSFINEPVALDTAVNGVKAKFTYNGAVTNTGAVSLGGFLIQPGVSGSFSFLTTTPITVGTHVYATGSNLLSATFFSGGSIAGPNNTTSGTFDANNQAAGSTLAYTSDFVTFSPGASLDASYSLTAIQAALNRVTSTSALRTFKADAGGSFSADPVPLANGVPEPASWALMIVGMGMMGAMTRRRRGAAVQA